MQADWQFRTMGNAFDFVSMLIINGKTRYEPVEFPTEDWLYL